jgi:hypothetical protein
MELKSKSLAQERFGTYAATYATSRSHAKGGSLPRLVELLAPQPAWTALDIATGAGHVALALAQLSQLGEKSERYQRTHSESRHYTALAGRRAIFSGAVIRGGGCGGRSSLRWRARSFWSAVSSV